MRLRVLALAALIVGALAGGAHAAPAQVWYRCQGPGSVATAIAACSKIIADRAEPADSRGYALVYRGNAYLARGALDLAAADFTAAASQPQPLAHAYYGLGQVLTARQDWAGAAAAFDKAAASTAEDADLDHFSFDQLGSFRQQPLIGKGFALLKGGNPDAAMAAFTEAARLCPSCAAPPRDESLALNTERKFPEALAAADHAIALDPRAPGSFFYRGVIRATMGKSALAVGDYSEAIRLQPTFAQAAAARTRAWSRMGQARQTDSPPLAAEGAVMDGAALRTLVSGKTWQATQGPWAADLEFRTDGSFVQRSRDQTDNQFPVEMDGAWAVVGDQLCVYTNRRLCMIGHLAGATLNLGRADGMLEYSGAMSAFHATHTDNASAPIREFPLQETFLPGSQARAGPGRTLLYYIHGFEGRATAHSPLLEPFLAEIQRTQGWDVVDADYPLDVGPNGQVMRFEAANYGSAAFVARRIKALKAQGYDRIVVGGQSWGGWTSLVLSTEPGLPLSGALLIVPACCGWLNTGDPHDAETQNNKLLFDQLIERTRYPTVAVFFTGDRGETADRGDNAAKVLSGHHVPALIIDHPAGFVGHGAGWFPLFDYEFRTCILTFLEAPAKAPSPADCHMRPLQDDDFRSVIGAGQLGAHKQIVPLKDLIGRTFAVWPDGALRKIVSDRQTQVTSYALGVTLWDSYAKGGAYCARAHIQYRQALDTDEHCVDLVKWSDHAMLAIDRPSGKVVQWWTERR